MNTQDVTRSVIRLELARAFRGMESNPKRTLRKLADLGKVCARGSVQKEIFGIFQQCLRYKDSPYFSVMQNLVRNVSAENLTTFGMNLGYNSWTDGAKKIRAKKDNEGILTSWIQILDLSQSEWTVENLNAFIDFWKTYGVCTYALLPSASFSENTFLQFQIQKHLTCDQKNGKKRKSFVLLSHIFQQMPHMIHLSFFFIFQIFSGRITVSTTTAIML